MELAMIGLGKMGANMATRLLRGGHRLIGYDLHESAIQAVEAEGAEGARTLEEAGCGQAVRPAGGLGDGALWQSHGADH